MATSPPPRRRRPRRARWKSPRAPTGAHIFAAEYYAEEVRRQIYERYGETKLYEGGLSVRTALDPRLQSIAKKTLMDGLIRFDEQRGWRGPVTKIEFAGDWGPKLAETKTFYDIPWKLAVVRTPARIPRASVSSRPRTAPAAFPAPATWA